MANPGTQLRSALLRERHSGWAQRLATALGPSYRWLIWVSLSLVAFNQLIQMFAYSVLIPSFLSELSLSYTLAGTLSSAYMLSLSAVMIPVGAMGDRVGGRYLVLGGLLAMTVGTALFAVADSYAFALASRVLVGAGAAVALVLPPPMLAHWFEKAQYRTVVGLHVSVGKMGSVVAMWLLPPLVVWFGWRLGYGIISLFGPLALLVGLLFLANRPADLEITGARTLAVAPAEKSATRPRGLPLTSLLRNRNLLLMAASEFFIFGNYFGMVNWLPTYFTSAASLSEVEAGFQTGFILWGTIVGYALSGPIANLVGRCAPVFAAGSGAAALLTLLFSTGTLVALPVWSWPPLMIVYGLTVSVMVLSLPIVVSFVPTASLATANGVVLTLGYLGAMVSPPLIGAVADATGSLPTAFWVAVASAALAFISATFIRESATGK